MWRNLKSPSICVQFMVFCCILNCFVAKFVFFWRFTLFCRKIGLLRFTRFCVEKILAKNSVRGEKMTNMRYGQARGVFLFSLRYVLERDISCVISFSVQMLPDIPEPPVYWAELDPRAEASHRGIISQMLVDFQPLSLVQNKGFLMDLYPMIWKFIP